jgi:hypothetical protein
MWVTTLSRSAIPTPIPNVSMGPSDFHVLGQLTENLAASNWQQPSTWSELSSPCYTHALYARIQTIAPGWDKCLTSVVTSWRFDLYHLLPILNNNMDIGTKFTATECVILFLKPFSMWTNLYVGLQQWQFRNSYVFAFLEYMIYNYWL